MKKEDFQETSPIDYPSALARIGNDTSFLSELLELYVMDFAEKQETLTSAIEHEDFKTIQEVGHSLKGASANLSLPYLQKASYELESAGRDRDLPKARKFLAALSQEFTKLKEHISDGAGT